MDNSITNTYNIGGMSCGGCDDTVKNKLSSVSGVKSVKVAFGKKQAEIESTYVIVKDSQKSELINISYTI
ncbi:MAG: heavy-metal-associated domain-containing protein, partial [Ignavibacteria bacterium]|nr:heavy-metal-associated domain-containing protein [Ignavibacteria bacterium]